jgi:hypothetical protein
MEDTDKTAEKTQIAPELPSGKLGKLDAEHPLPPAETSTGADEGAGATPRPNPIHVHIHSPSGKWREPLNVSTLILAGVTLYFVGQTHCDAERAVETANRTNAKIIEMERITNEKAISASQAINERIIDTQRTTTKDSIRATVGQGKKAMEINAALSWLDQRPWLSVDRFEVDAEMKDSNDIFISLWLKNTGKTPALHQTAQTKLLLMEQEPSVAEMNDPWNPADARAAFTIPSGSINNRVTHSWSNIDAALLADYKARKRRLYIHGTLRYTDMLQQSHVTRVCVYHVWGDAPGSFTYCKAVTENSME